MPTNPLRWLFSLAEPHAGGAAKNVLVVGLGRFGSALAETLVELGLDVMAIDKDPELVQRWAPHLTDVREADASNAEALRQISAGDFDAAVVAIGTDLEASILATAALADVGISQIWAKALSDEHGRILDRVGANHVVYPEKQMGVRVAHSVSGQMVDYFQLDDNFVIAEVLPHASLIGLSLGEAELRRRHNVNVVSVKRRGGEFQFANAETRIEKGDLLVVAGSVADAQRFANLT